MANAWSGHLKHLFEKHERINVHCVVFDGEDVGVLSIVQLGAWGFILPVVFKLAPNLDLVKDDSLPVASFNTPDS